MIDRSTTHTHCLLFWHNMLLVLFALQILFLFLFSIFMKCFSFYSLLVELYKGVENEGKFNTNRSISMFIEHTKIKESTKQWNGKKVVMVKGTITNNRSCKL